MGAFPFSFHDTSFGFVAPNTIQYDGQSYDVTKPTEAESLLSAAHGYWANNVACVLDTWLLQNLPPRWCMHCFCHLFPADAAHAAFCLGTDLRGNPRDISTPQAQHDWVDDVYRKH